MWGAELWGAPKRFTRLLPAFEVVCAEDHLQPAAAHFPRNGGSLGWKITSRTASANSRSRHPQKFVHLTIQGRCARNFFQTSSLFTVTVANPAQSSTLKQYLADPRNDSLSLLDRHPSYTTGVEGRQQEYQPLVKPPDPCPSINFQGPRLSASIPWAD